LRSFLLSGPIVLTKEELEDARRREEADRVRENGRKRFAREIAVIVDSLREAMKSVKGDIMGKGKCCPQSCRAPGPLSLHRWFDQCICHGQGDTGRSGSSTEL
jgi:hypothetical protein